MGHNQDDEAFLQAWFEEELRRHPGRRAVTSLTSARCPLGARAARREDRGPPPGRRTDSPHVRDNQHGRVWVVTDQYRDLVGSIKKHLSIHFVGLGGDRNGGGT